MEIATLPALSLADIAGHECGRGALAKPAPSPELVALAAARRQGVHDFNALPNDIETEKTARWEALSEALTTNWQAIADFMPRSVADLALIAAEGVDNFDASTDFTTDPVVAVLIAAIGCLAQG